MTMIKKTKNIIRNILLVFVLISIGFALGKYSVTKQTIAEKTNANGEVIHVYYMHAAFRCVTCNTIEKMTKELLDSKFADGLKSGKIIFSKVNFQENEKLARQFEVISSCVVVAKEKDGNIIGYKRLDEVWTLLDKPAEFNAYVSKAIQSFLSEQEDAK